MKPRAPPMGWMFSMARLDDVVHRQGDDRQIIPPGSEGGDGHQKAHQGCDEAPEEEDERKKHGRPMQEAEG